MINLPAAFLGLASIFLLLGCASTPDLTPIEDYEKRLEFNGFSVLPPGGADWSSANVNTLSDDRNPTVSFVKKDGDLTFYADGKIMDFNDGIDPRDEEELQDPEKLMKAVKGTKLFQEGPRQTNMVSTFGVDESLGTPCVRFDLNAEDTQVPGRPGETFKLDSHGYYCHHPISENVILHILYSRRAPKSESYIAGKEEGERFLQSVKFTAFKR